MLDQTLYGLNKDGTFKVWRITVWPDSNGNGVITIVHGKDGGKQQRKDEVVKEGKQGRNPVEQAVFMAEARIKKQVDKNYRPTKEELSDIPLLPMLAKDFNEEGHRIIFPCWGSVKYDGVRCFAILNEDGTVTLKSRTGQDYEIPHLQEALKEIFELTGETRVLDGEVYLHGYVLQEIVSAVKRTDPEDKIAKAERALERAQKKGEEAVAEALTKLNDALLIADIRQNLQFHAFDIVDLEKTFEERIIDLEGFDRICVKHFQTTKYERVLDRDHMKELHKGAVDRGYEGWMLRNDLGLYESGKRSADLQKYKEFLDKEFEVVDTNLDKDGGIIYVCKNDLNDNRFNVVMGDLDDRKERAKNPKRFVGKPLTVKFQSRYKGTLLPQFPVGVVFRDYE